MKKKVLFILAAFILCITFVTKLITSPPIVVIFDTDLFSDVDDVGAVTVLHSLANKGQVNILATMVSSGDPWAASWVTALNTFLPIAAI